MVLSVLQQTLYKVVSNVCYWLRRRSGGGEVEREEEGGGGEVRLQRLFIHSHDFFHMMRRPWIEASRLWRGKHANIQKK